MNTLFEFVIDSSGIAITLFSFERFTLFAFVCAVKPKKIFGVTLFNIPLAVTKGS